MKFKNIIFFGSLLLIGLSCIKKIPNYNKEKAGIIVNDEITSSRNYFKASGTEPFWGLEVSESQIKLKLIGDSLIMPYIMPAKSMDANVKMYRLQAESGTMTIKIQQIECTNAMSGMVSPYRVVVDYKKKATEKEVTLIGCGNYIADYRLHDIWVLEKLNGNVITKEDFSKGFPLLEINSSKKTFTGFAGCNRINGQLFTENDLLGFTKIISTKMMCEPTNKESEFLKELQSATNYKIENNRLRLSNAGSELIIFKKIE